MSHYNGAPYGYNGCPYGFANETSGFTGLLDSLPATYGAWSVARRLKATYSGPLIRVENVGDSSEEDFGYDANGDLDVAGIESFCGANNGRIAKIYNQDANGTTLDFIQSTVGVRPLIAESGVVCLLNGKPTVKFVAADSQRLFVNASTALFNCLHNGTSSVVNSVFKVNDTASLKYILATQSVGTGRGFAWLTGGSETLNVNVGSGSASVVAATKGSASTAQRIITTFLDADNATAASREATWADGSLLSGSNASANAVSAGDAGFNLTLGANGNNASPFDGCVQELLIWNTDATASRTIWEADQSAYY